jgi:hypothetical protein
MRVSQNGPFIPIPEDTRVCSIEGMVTETKPEVLGEKPSPLLTANLAWIILGLNSISLLVVPCF